MSNSQAAKLIGNLHVKTLQKYARLGRLPGYQIGRHWYLSSFAACELLMSDSKSPASSGYVRFGCTGARLCSRRVSSPTVAARGDAALPFSQDDAVAIRSGIQMSSDMLRMSWRDPCRRSDAGFPRLSNWRRRCMTCHFNSSRNDSPFAVGSALFVCWSESQVWNSLSF